MNQSPPLYTKEEKIKCVVKHALWLIPFVIIMQFWGFPYIEEYSATAYCKNYGAFTGLHVVFYGLFIGLPLLSALVYFYFIGRRSLKIIKAGQDPLPNEKVFTKTEYVYGRKAKFKAYAMLGILLFFIGLSIQGYFWAKDIIETIQNQNEIKTCSGKEKSN